jgi:predicted nucleotide-binding protein (sugar kinase/HSP70/actin superfamily)
MDNSAIIDALQDARRDLKERIRKLQRRAVKEGEYDLMIQGRAKDTIEQFNEGIADSVCDPNVDLTELRKKALFILGKVWADLIVEYKWEIEAVQWKIAETAREQTEKFLKETKSGNEICS